MTSPVQNPNVFGACTSDSTSNTITIVRSIQNDSGVDSSSIMNAANKYINGNYTTPDGMNITVNLELISGPGESVIHNAVVIPGEAPRSYAEVGGNNIYLHEGADSYSSAHEIAHNLGLSDTYTETQQGVVTNQPGLMGTYGDHMIATEAAALYDNYCNSTISVQIIGSGAGGGSGSGSGNGQNMAMDSAGCMFFGD